MTHRRGLLDTSAVISAAAGDVSRDGLPPEVSISTVTLCGLHHGAAIAPEAVRPQRLAVLAFAERSFVPMTLDVEAAPQYARLAGAARALGKRTGSRLADLLIAATAGAHSMPLYTRDAEQAAIAERAGIEAVVV